MVVFEDGLPRKSEYRRFIVRGTVDEQGAVRTDDTAAMHEVLTRRFRRYLDDRVDATDIEGVGTAPAATTGRPRRFGRRRLTATRAPGQPDRPRHRPPPPLRLPAQPRRRRRRPAPGQRRPRRRWPSSASTTSRSSAWPSGWRRSGCPGEDFPVILPRTSEGLYLLQRVRDEAHRFAITFHRQRRSKAMTTSVARRASPGWATRRRKALLRALRLGEAAPGRLGGPDRAGARASDPRWPRPLRTTLAAPSRPRPCPRVNVTTGEVLD